MNKTAEEILEGKPSFFYTEDFVFHKSDVVDAMKQYSRQVSIAFAEWIRENCIKHSNYEGCYIGDNGITCENDSELYNLFLSQYNKEEK